MKNAHTHSKKENAREFQQDQQIGDVNGAEPVGVKKRIYFKDLVVKEIARNLPEWKRKNKHRKKLVSKYT